MNSFHLISLHSTAIKKLKFSKAKVKNTSVNDAFETLKERA